MGAVLVGGVGWLVGVLEGVLVGFLVSVGVRGVLVGGVLVGGAFVEAVLVGGVGWLVGALEGFLVGFLVSVGCFVGLVGLGVRAVVGKFEGNGVGLRVGLVGLGVGLGVGMLAHTKLINVQSPLQLLVQSAQVAAVSFPQFTSANAVASSKMHTADCIPIMLGFGLL